MAITDELRSWADVSTLSSWTIERLRTIADRIDAEHEQQCAESWMRGHDAWAAIDRSDEMAEHGWVRLPKDADGEYIHVGDLMEDGKKVARIVLTDGEWEPYVLLYDKPNYLREYFCGEIGHYKPTVEDVLEKALNEAAMLDRPEGYWPSAADITNIVISLASKLQLRGEDA